MKYAKDRSVYGHTLGEISRAIVRGQVASFVQKWPLTAREEVEAIRINCQRGDRVQVSYHGLHQAATVVVPEADVAVLVAGDGKWQRWVRHNLARRKNRL